jgi:hypothetical protein
MKRGKQIDTWYPFYIDKWLFGSTRHELIIGPDWAEKFPDLAPIIPQSVLSLPFADLRGIFTDIMTMSKKDGGYLRANETTPYPLEQLAGMWCVPIDWLKATVAICLHSSVGKLTEPSPGIYYIVSTETYALSDRWKRQFAKAEGTSERTEATSKKPVAREEKRRGDKKREKEEVVDLLLQKASEIISNWNRFAEGHNLPKVKGLPKGSSRERVLLQRLREKDFDFEKLLKAIHAQPFLYGDNDRGWLVTFDWILKPANLTKILEGAYIKNRIGDAARRAPEDPHVGGRRN